MLSYEQERILGDISQQLGIANILFAMKELHDNDQLDSDEYVEHLLELLKREGIESGII